MIDKNKQPGIRCDQVILKEINFSRSYNYNEKPEMNIEFSGNPTFSEDQKELSYELTLKVTESKTNPIFTLSCTMVGVFSVEDNANMPLSEYAKINAPSTIFPFIREVAADITMRSGLKPFLIPPINVISLINNN